MLGKVVETIAVGVANVAIRVIDYLQERREHKRPKLDPPIKTLSIDEAVRRAQEQRSRMKNGGDSGQSS